MAKKKTTVENVEYINLHKGHRARMDERFKKTLFMGWSDYEILEYMLYATNPRRNTSELAHIILSKFGTLENVTSAGIDELKKIKGVGTATARHLSTLTPYALHINAKTSDLPRKFDLSTDKTIKYVKQQFSEEIEEMVIMICLDSKNQLIKTEILSRGTFHHADLDIVRTTRLAVGSNASKVIFAHNHPSGNAIPSESDIQTTDWLTSALSSCGIVVLEHIIVTNNNVGLVKKYQKTGDPYPQIKPVVNVKSYN